MFRRLRHIVGFYNVSIIVPLFQGMDIFRKNLSANQVYFRQNGIELIIAADENCTGVEHLADEFPFINWKIISVPGLRQDHRKASVLLNAGLQHARHQYILYIHPHTIFTSDVIYRSRYILHHYPQCFTAIHSDEAGISWSNGISHGKGIVMVQRQLLMGCGGFEQGEEFQLINSLTQEKLERAQLNKMIIAEGGFLLTAADPRNNRHWNEPASNNTGDQPAPNAAPAKEYILFDWAMEKSSALPDLVLGKFQRFFMRTPEDLSRQHQLICLIQIRNESSHLPGVLDHINGICDGIILLDDGSTDGSYEKAHAGKLLLKVQKAFTGKFNDLENRNLLLELAHLFRSEWFLFLDADERFAFHRPALDPILQMKEIDTVSFRLVHIWDKKDQYRKDLPEGRGGVLRRYRLFRSKGFMQIPANRDLHFCVTPFRQEKYNSPLLLLHYGLMEAAIRKSKKDLYLAQDNNGKKQGYSYDYLTDEDPQLANLDDLISGDRSP